MANIPRRNRRMLHPRTPSDQRIESYRELRNIILKLICTEDEVALMQVKDSSASRARLVDGGCHNFANRRSGKVWRAIEEQKISTQV